MAKNGNGNGNGRKKTKHKSAGSKRGPKENKKSSIADNIRDVLKGKMKVFSLDTNVLIRDPMCIYNFASNGPSVIVLSGIVFKEMNAGKSAGHESGLGGREFSRTIDELLKASGKLGQMRKGLVLENGCVLFRDDSPVNWKLLPPDSEKSNDNKILAQAISLRQKLGLSEDRVVVVTNDRNMRIDADSYGIVAEEYEADAIPVKNVRDLYSGFVDINVSDDQYKELLLWHRQEKPEPIPLLRMEEVLDKVGQLVLLPNQVLFFNGEKRLAVVYKDGFFSFVPTKDECYDAKFKPINLEQKTAYKFLLDESIAVVSISGGAGTGKTVLALGAANKTVNDNRFSKIRVLRPNIEAGNPMGYLPGSKEEKFLNFAQPILDAFDFVLGKKMDGSNDPNDSPARNLLGNILEIEPVNFERGFTYRNTIVIVDEAQNLTPGQLKMILTRLGSGSKAIVVGDPSQIDHPFLDYKNNALSVAAHNFKEEKNMAHILLRKTERSDVAEQVARLLAPHCKTGRPVRR